MVVVGHARLEAAKRLALESVPIQYQDFASEEEEYSFHVADNAIASWAELDLAAINVDIGELGPFDIDMLGLKDFTVDVAERGAVGEHDGSKLSDKFLIPPFTVLNAREGWWQERKKEWLALGIKSEIGRDGMLLTGGSNSIMASINEGTSVFDPVLCELVYRWFSPANALVLDPFAGGSVRGVVAAKLNRQYVGVELRDEQVKENQKQGTEICDGAQYMPVWHCGSSVDIQESCAGVQADLVFSCPPYADLEVYSEDPRDLSNMSYDKFLQFYRDIIAKSVTLLKPNRFAAFVVGEVRDKKNGYYRGFVPDTIKAFEDAGAAFYNEAILVTSVGTLPYRAGRTFSASRKLGKTHQNILVFVKGDPKEATKACGEVEVNLDIGGHDQIEDNGEVL